MATVDLSDYDSSLVPDASNMRFGIVVSEWNSNVTNALLRGAYNTLLQHGVSPEDILVKYVPGSFELIFGSQQMIDAEVDAVIALGCVVRGETPHFEYVCQGVTYGIAKLNTDYDVPVIFGVLTTDNIQQALDRAGGIHGNKGVETAIAAIKMANFYEDLE